MSLLESLPQEVLIDDLFPLLPLKPALALFATNKFFAKLGNDEIYWKRRLREDFNFTNASNARNSGFKFLYSRLQNPKIFVWGESGEGRLGRPASQGNSWRIDKKQYWPLEVQIPKRRIVELAAGGWSFTALDSTGSVWVWGQLESGYGLIRDGFANNSKQASRPLQLKLPKPIQTINCGRNFSVALDQDGSVWCFISWGQPFLYKPRVFDPLHPGSRIVQVECGWTFIAALSASGVAYVWNPTAGEVGDAYDEKNEEFDRMGSQATTEEEREAVYAPEVDGFIQCFTWTMEGAEPLTLPELPELPVLKSGKPHPRLVKIAAGDQFLIGLTDGGHVLKMDLDNINQSESIQLLATAFQQRTRRWEYMPQFCEREKISELQVFREGKAELPQELEINHISAHFLTFVAYTTGRQSIVLMGANGPSQTVEPTVIPNLQNRGVISIVLGDYHWGALLDNGKLLTWGAAGSTGLGDPHKIEPGQPGGFRTQQDRDRTAGPASLPDVREPTEVRFDHGLKKSRERFVFAAAAAGWHMGALVVDLQEGEPEEATPEEELPEPVNPPPPSVHSIPPPGMLPPFIYRGGMMSHHMGLAGSQISRHQPPPNR